jgi:hypothetical protein
MSNLILQAMEAKHNGNTNLARQLLAQALIENPRDEGAWMMMSELVEDVKLKRNCLQRVLLINPDNSAANLALAKLDTSPLGGVVRGERYKPITPPQAGKTPAFTPPFTWSGEDSQFQALGDMTYPEQEEEQADEHPEVPPSFDWAEESTEPDKTIDKIFEAVSNPELASEPLPDSDLSLADQVQPAEEMATAEVEGGETTDESGESHEAVEAVQAEEAQLTKPEDFEVSAESELGLQAFAPAEGLEAESTEPASFLWDNPQAKIDRMVILGFTSIIYANPAASDVPHIVGLFNENKMVRDLLGKEAGTIRLESIQCLSANPTRASLVIEYKQDNKKVTHSLMFKDLKTRDEALSAIKLRLGAGFQSKMRTYSGMRKFGWPLVCMLILAVLGWSLTGGLSLLSNMPAFQDGLPLLIVYNLQYYVDIIGTSNVLMIALVGILVCLIWLISNLPKPAKLMVVERE